MNGIRIRIPATVLMWRVNKDKVKNFLIPHEVRGTLPIPFAIRFLPGFDKKLINRANRKTRQTRHRGESRGPEVFENTGYRPGLRRGDDAGMTLDEYCNWPNRLPFRGNLQGHNALTWTVGVVMGGNTLGLSEHETVRMDAGQLQLRIIETRERFFNAGAHYVINTLADLIPVIDEINGRLSDGGMPDWMRFRCEGKQCVCPLHEGLIDRVSLIV